MRLRFDPGDDDDAFAAARDALLDELGSWLDRPERERAAVVTDVEILLDWRYRDSNGVLDELAPGDVTEFLLQWCPSQFQGHPNGAEFLCNAVAVYVDFMAATGRLMGGIERANRLRKLAVDLAPTVRAELGTLTPVVDSFVDDEDDEQFQAALAEIEERYGTGPVEEPDPYELPFVYIPPPLADVETAAAAAPLLAKLKALRDYLGTDGKQLTDKGNLKLADGHALVDLLDTGDEMDPQIGDKTWRTSSTADLPQLNFIVDIAKQTGAVRVHHRRLVPVKAWATRPTLQRAAALFAAIVELGPLESLFSGRIWFLDEMHELLDDGIVHWLAPLLADDTAELGFDSILEWAQSVVDRRIAPRARDWMRDLGRLTHRDMSRIFEVLEDAGVVQWVGRSEIPEEFGRNYWTGGTVTLTALGRHVLPDYLDESGYALRRADTVADGDGAELIETLLSAPETQQQALIASWQSDRPDIERVRMLTEAIAQSPSAATRMMGFFALHSFDVEVAEPWVRQLLDTPVAGHAALWLVQRDLADAETVGNFVDVPVLVDVLSAAVESPEELCSLFAGMSEPLQLLENMWRHPAPETAEVLDALGRHLPDRALAKAARKAAVRHRSWLANRP
ncbi:hypothetical protein [Mycobacterium sp. E3198]|uniref:hypothetical protein n=1 Tax=Mycobacterium sp. E3198 TaxID=1834143 RepID=UPI0007FCF2AB|nr:hypothetical protein [Mycobacterium sp. E3198]OBG30642.1 hypothetical protein A5673_03795 [Mycobacterium sp. E3198]